MTLVIAHRGASAERPEQTRAAYELAIEQGADGVECDVRLTADREVVCFHDPTTDRTLGMPGEIASLPLATVRERGVLTLADLIAILRAAQRPLVLAIELKHPNPYGLELEAAVLRVLDEAGWDAAASAVEQVTVSLMSFNPLSIGALAAVPARHLMVLTSELSVDDLDEGPLPAEAAEQLAAALAGGLQLIDAGMVGGAGPDVDFCRAHPERVRGWIDAGRTVRVWTADTPEDVAYLVDLGVQQITTNVPALVRRFL